MIGKVLQCALSFRPTSHTGEGGALAGKDMTGCLCLFTATSCILLVSLLPLQWHFISIMTLKMAPLISSMTSFGIVLFVYLNACLFTATTVAFYRYNDIEEGSFNIKYDLLWKCACLANYTWPV